MSSTTPKMRRSMMAWVPLIAGLVAPQLFVLVGMATNTLMGLEEAVSVSTGLGVALALLVVGLACGVYALFRGDRSWVVWCGMLVCLASGAYLLASTGNLSV